ncbi:MAG: hypothetical protein J0H68_09865 [Sphingobacteriia bacterium]|nr:hypothetical protein [Sphingobacteriia bacterium]
MFKRFYVLLMLAFITLSASKSAVENDRENKKVIHLSIESSKDSQVAKIKDIKDKGVELGLNEMKLIGTISESKEMGSLKKDKIKWHSATLNEKTIPLSKHFESDVVVKKEKGLENGDQVKAMGDPVVLIKALNQLKTQEKKEDKADINNKMTYNNTSKMPASVGNSSPRNSKDHELPGFNPTFQEKHVPTIVSTYEGCEVRIDSDPGVMKVFVQEQTIVDGVPQNDCKDSDKAYPIIKDYKTCDVLVDIKKGEVYQQYKLVYTNTSNGSIVPIDGEGCRPNTEEENIIKIQQTANGCKQFIKDDGTIVYKKKYYVLNDKVIDLPPGCEPVLDSNVLTKDCENNRYSHFFKEEGNPTGYSKINKSFYYVENGQEIPFETCIPSGEALPHKYVECGFNHNDYDKYTELKYRTFIKYKGQEVEIQGCKVHDKKDYEPISLPVYVKEETQSGARIHLKDENFYADTNNPFIYAGDILNYFPQINEGYGSLISRVDPKFKYHAKKYNFGELKASYGLSNGDHGYSPYITDVYEYCLKDNPANSKPWLANGTSVNDKLSDQLPYWKVSFYDTGRTNGEKNKPIYKLDCTEPRCDLLTYRIYKAYRRADNSLFINKNELFGKELICGTGKLVDALNPVLDSNDNVLKVGN